jgi:hypothetical protein
LVLFPLRQPLAARFDFPQGQATLLAQLFQLRACLRGWRAWVHCRIRLNTLPVTTLHFNH